MTPKLQTMRDRLEQRIQEVNRARREASAQQQGCEHDWQPFKETVNAVNVNFVGTAVLRLLGCPKCKARCYTHLEITRTA